MKAIIETVTGSSMHVDIDISNSPIVIVQKLYKENPTAASQIFSNQKAIDQLMEGNIDETKSTFEFIDVSGNSIRTNWKEPLCNQCAMKKELSKIEAEGQVPTFVVSVSSIVA